MAVDIPENHLVERMMKVLRRKTLNEKYEEKWRKTYHVKKGEVRRLELKDAKYRIFKAQFRERMKWIYRRRARYAELNLHREFSLRQPFVSQTNRSLFQTLHGTSQVKN